jgi:nucleotide-binding universal stress UspA family protein
MAPLSGGEGDKAAIAAAAMLAEPFGAEMAGVYAPPDVADVMPWMGEGFMGGVQTTALESLKEAAAAGEKKAAAAMEACGYAKKAFIALQTPVWAGLSAESRLSDVVVFASDPARGRGPLAEAFQQMVADEQRPVLIAREGLTVGGTVAVAWDGGKEASRAARAAAPWLLKAPEAVVLAAPAATPRTFEPSRLVEYLAGRGAKVRLEQISGTGEAAPLLLESARGLGAAMLVAGAFGHPRFQQFIFGGATRTLMQADGPPSLFLSH